MPYPNTASVYGSDPWASVRTPQMPTLAGFGQPGQYGVPPATGGTGAKPGGAASPYQQSPWLKSMLALIMQNAGARTAGARGMALRASPNDPSLAAYAGLEAQLGGQSDASGQMAQTANSYYGQMDSQQFQEMMLRLRAQLEEEAAKKAAGNPLMGGLGKLVGTATGSWLSPGGIWKGKG
jgi:hypothetical protein